MHRIFRQVLWVALSATAAVAGAALVSPVLAATFVYVGCAESNDIYVLQLNRQTGELSLRAPRAETQQVAIAVEPGPS